MVGLTLVGLANVPESNLIICGAEMDCHDLAWSQEKLLGQVSQLFASLAPFLYRISGSSTGDETWT